MFILKTLGSIAAMIAASKIVGVRQIAQLTAYDYISGITVGSIAASMAIDDSIPVYYPIVAILIYGVVTRLIGYLTGKSIVLRRFFTGKPTVMINNGKILIKALRQHNYDVNDLLLECRIQGYFNLDDIQCAVMETNGEISILPKPQYRPAQPSDLKLPTAPDGIRYNLMIDGKTLHNNLKSFGKDSRWLKQELKEQGIKNESDVLAAFGNPDGSLSVYKKHTDKTPPDCFM